MSKIAICADLHYGVPGKLPHIQWAAETVNRYCERAGIDVVLCLGDLAHDRSAMDLETACGLHDMLAGARHRGIRWITFPGNHDMFLKHSWEINSLRPFSGVLEVLETTKLLQLDGRRFWILPFIHLEQCYMEVLGRLEQRCAAEDVLLTHIGVRGATLNTCFLLKDWHHVSFEQSRFRRIYTGHFHSNQSLDDQVFYPGSLIPFKFDEGNISHGFYVLDLETMEHQFVDIWEAGAQLQPGTQPPPQYYTVLDEQLPELEPGDLEGNIIRIAITRECTNDEKVALREQLLGHGAAAVRLMLAVEEQAPQITPGGEAAHPDPFRRWILEDERGTSGLDRQLLLRLNDEIRAEGDRLYCHESEL